MQCQSQCGTVLGTPVNMPSGLASSCAGDPTSAATPRSMTRTRSQSMMVCSRCAMATMVQSANSSRTVDWMSASVSTSTFAVASSNTRICSKTHNKSPLAGSRWVRLGLGLPRLGSGARQIAVGTDHTRVVIRTRVTLNRSTWDRNV